MSHDCTRAAARANASHRRVDGHRREQCRGTGTFRGIPARPAASSDGRRAATSGSTCAGAGATSSARAATRPSSCVFAGRDLRLCRCATRPALARDPHDSDHLRRRIGAGRGRLRRELRAPGRQHHGIYPVRTIDRRQVAGCSKEIAPAIARVTIMVNPETVRCAGHFTCARSRQPRHAQYRADHEVCASADDIENAMAALGENPEQRPNRSARDLHNGQS